MKRTSHTEKVIAIIVGLVIVLFVVRQATPHWMKLYPEGALPNGVTFFGHFTSYDACEVSLEASKRQTQRVLAIMKSGDKAIFDAALGPEISENTMKMQSFADKEQAARCVKVHWGDQGY